MSHPQNEKWLEHAQDNLEQAIAEGNYSLCKDIIADVQDAGFLEAGRSMNHQMREAPVENWQVKSPIQPNDL